MSFHISKTSRVSKVYKHFLGLFEIFFFFSFPRIGTAHCLRLQNFDRGFTKVLQRSGVLVAQHRGSTDGKLVVVFSPVLLLLLDMESVNNYFHIWRDYVFIAYTS